MGPVAPCPKCGHPSRIVALGSEHCMRCEKPARPPRWAKETYAEKITREVPPSPPVSADAAALGSGHDYAAGIGDGPDTGKDDGPESVDSLPEREAVEDSARPDVGNAAVESIQKPKLADKTRRRKVRR